MHNLIINRCSINNITGEVIYSNRVTTTNLILNNNNVDYLIDSYWHDFQDTHKQPENYTLVVELYITNYNENNQIELNFIGKMTA